MSDIPTWVHVSIAVIVIILAVQLIVNDIIKELKANSGESLRDAVDRAQAIAQKNEAAVARLEATTVRVANELHATQLRATGTVGAPGEASDAAMKGPPGGGGNAEH